MAVKPRRIVPLFIVASFGAAALVSTAEARTLWLHLTHDAEQIGFGSDVQLLELESGVTSAELTVFAQSQVTFSFSAECSVAADDDQTWLDIDILLDGVPLTPTDDDNAFCTSTGDGSTSAHWFSASADAALLLAPGTWLGIQIYLSGQLLAPTGTSFAFCTSDGTPGGGWSTASTTLTFDVPPPAVANSLTVEARLFPFDEGETARLDDVQLTVVQVLAP